MPGCFKLAAISASDEGTPSVEVITGWVLDLPEQAAVRNKANISKYTVGLMVYSFESKQKRAEFRQKGTVAREYKSAVQDDFGFLLEV